ncbi:MAG: DEAD/DEAH box helicase [Candidatus Cloacimonetes bacterium]|nr:DEAD/DEAH box helicase [Candidatus Cloacimonadota bacterium]
MKLNEETKKAERFENLGLIQPLLKAIKEKNYTEPTQIQSKSIPLVLSGQDVLGCAQTGTGKTAAFAIPILQHLYQERHGKSNSRKIRSLIITPTRELAIQIAESFTLYGKYTKIRNTVIFGGVKQRAQTDALRRGVDILVATPGRLLDLMDQGYIRLNDVEYFVLDEADRMLDMGFIHDIRKIIAKLPVKRQSLFFSATMPRKIVDLSHKILRNPTKVEVSPEAPTVEIIQQNLYYTNRASKKDLLFHILRDSKIEHVLLFSRTKHGCDRIVRNLKSQKIKAAAIHGDKTQNNRQKALEQFKAGEIRVLVATDIAARGIDINKLKYVINYDIPNISETYVHRIGRTGRAGEEGSAISICEPEENGYIRDIEKLIKRKITVVENNPFPQTDKPMTASEKKEWEKEKQQRKNKFFAAKKEREAKRKVFKASRKRY